MSIEPHRLNREPGDEEAPEPEQDGLHDLEHQAGGGLPALGDGTTRLDNRRYWQERLRGTSGVLELPGHRPCSKAPAPRRIQQSFALPTALTGRLQQLADELEVGLFSLLITSWAILLGRHAGQTTLVVASPVSSEDDDGGNGFVDLLPIRFDLTGNPTVAELLRVMDERIRADQAHQDLSWDDLQGALAGQDFTLPTVVFAFQNAPRRLDFPQVDQGLILVVEPPAETDPDAVLRGWLVGAAERFAATTCERLLRGWPCLLADLRPERRRRRLAVLPVAERHQLLVEGRDRAMAFPRQATVHELFAATAAATPAAVALADELDNHLSYAVLDRRANGLAHALTHLGIDVESRVALGLERSIEAVVAILAVLKAGGVYLPLDPDHPLDRLAFMIGESDCQVLITDRASLVKVSSTANRCQLPLIILSRDLTMPRDQPPPRDVDAQNLAYVMFTSGSTGKAKGVAVSHRNVVRLVRGNDFARLDRDETFLSFAPLAFDASTLELWGPLLNGGRLAIFPSGPAALGELAGALRRQRVTTLWLTAGLFHQMVDLELAALGGLRQLLAGGDVLSPERSRRVLDELPATTLINGYGPTETTTFACCHAMTDGAQVRTTVAIGRPLGNARVQVLDRYLEPAPIGVGGELMIAGDGVARGYARRPDLTAARFLPEPAAPRPGERMYRTGDLARWLVDGRLEFLGRFDFQVKIRGFRIELGEIQSALEEHPGLAQAMVLTEQWGSDARDLRLIACAVPSGEERPASDELRTFLARRLPPYMVPSRILLLDALPLGATGKVDRAALAKLAAAPPRQSGAAPRLAPRTPLEESLLPIFAELLRGEDDPADGAANELGVEDDFFANGGHSLVAAQLIARIKVLCGVEVAMSDFFAAPTVAGLAAAVERTTSSEIPPLTPQKRPDDLPPSFAQERLWLLDRLGQRTTYNIPWPFALRGPLDVGALTSALESLVARHQALRTTFAQHGGRVVQVIHPDLQAELPIVDLSRLDDPAATARRLGHDEAHRPFDLARGLLLRTVLLRLGKAQHHLLLTVHHIAADGWSMGVLSRELGELYDAARLHRASALPALPVQYADYALWQRGWLLGELLERQLTFWRHVLEGAPPLLELPTDRPRPTVASPRGGVVERRLDAALLDAVKGLARARQTTPFVVVLTAFASLLMRSAGTGEACIGFPVAGRRNLQLEKLIGFFVNTLVLRARHLRGEPWTRLLARLRGDVVQAIAYQDVPFERLVEELAPQRSPGHMPIVQVVLAFLNAPIPPPRMHELVVERLDAVLEIAKFDLTLSCEPRDDGSLRCELSYRRDLFDRATVERFLLSFETLLHSLVTAPERPVDEHELISAAERRQLYIERADSRAQPIAETSWTGFTAPRTASEEVLARLMSEVLELEEVGVEDDFFKLGGHSLLAARLLARVQATLDAELSLNDFFAHPTVAALAAAVEQATGTEIPPLEPQPRADDPPLSFAQERLWLVDRLGQHRTTYNIPWPLELAGPLDTGALAGALGHLVMRHEVLRTTFARRGEQLVQVIHPRIRSELPIVDLRHLDDADAVAVALAHDDAHRPFDLARGPLLRAVLLRLGGEHHHLLLNVHHIATDGWSMRVLCRELGELYDAALAGRPSLLPTLPVQYADYAIWQRGWLRGELLERQLAFWRRALAGAPTLLELPTDRPRPAVISPRGGIVERHLDAALLDAVKELAGSRQTTPFVVVMAAFAALLTRYANAAEAAVGFPVAGRRGLELDGLIGFFVNTLVLRARRRRGEPWSLLLERLRGDALQAIAHQDIPFERLVEELAPERSTSHTPFFQVMLAFLSEPIAPPRMRGLEVERLDVALEAAKFDLTLSCEPRQDGRLRCELSYSRDLFDRTTIERFMGGFETLLRGLLAAPERPPETVELTGAVERHQLCVEWIDSAAELDTARTLPELVAAQIARRPDAVATSIEDGDERALTYGELGRRVDRLAAELRRQGVGPEVLVGVAAERSLELILALLAIHRAGGAYVPIDPSYPEERQALMIDDALGDGGLLLTQAHLAAAFERPGDLRNGEPRNGGPRCLVIDAWRDRPLPAAPWGRAAPDNLAYTIYTSGSTGNPKGAMNSHRAILNRLLWGQTEIPLGPDDRVLQKTPYSFDVSVWELFWPLIVGARQVFAKPGGHKDSAYLARLIVEARITTLHFVPSMMEVFVEQPGLEHARSVERVLASGEALPRELQDRFFARLPSGVELYNLYGPTEAAVEVSCWRCHPARAVPIGRPVANTDLLVLDRDAGPQPIGVPGQLHLGGIQVARGYLRRAALTAEKFIPHSLAHTPGERLYATGDLVRWRTDGAVEYIGRVDHQVKIRGFRIELGEIEVRLRSHPSVREAVVMVRPSPSGDPRLVAFLVPQTGQELDVDELRAHLGAQVPEHMVPTALEVLDTLPLLPNGKIDRHALSRRELHQGEAPEASYVAPRTPTEELLATLMSELLGVARVGIEDDFFKLGGHSLLAAQLLARIHASLDVELALSELFARPTIAALAAALGGANAERTLPPLLRYDREAEVLPSFAQERLWFLDQLLPSNAVYNVPWPLTIAGELDRTALETALNRLVERHEVLRTTFAERDDEVVQVIHPSLELGLPIVDLSGLPGAEETARRLAREDADRPFDLRRGPLLRATLLRLGPTRHQLLLNIHHIVSDGWSMIVVGRELGELYSAAHLGRPDALPALPVQYADYALWQRGWLRGAMIERQAAFWRGVLDDAPSLLELPTDRPRPAVFSYRGGVVERRLDPALYDALTRLARAHQATPFMIVLAAFDILLMRHAGCDDLCVGFPVAGRRELELEKLIGFFVNTLVLRARRRSQDDLGSFLDRLRDHVLQALVHQDVPFERLVEVLEPERSLSHTPFFQVMLAFLNAPIAPPCFAGVEVERLDSVLGSAKFDLTLGCEPSPDGGLRCDLSYSSDLFDAATMERFLGGFETLLHGLVADPERPLAALPLIGEVERHQIFAEWNDTARELATDHTLPELVMARLAERPDGIAVTLGFSGEQLSGSELTRRAVHLAGILAERGVGPEVLVGIAALRSLELVIGMLGILEAGGAYVPIDPSYPEDRQAMMIEDALGTGGVLLTQRALVDKLPKTAGCEVLALDALPPSAGTVTARRARPDNLAYAIYTSGSTGRPKGAMNAHRAVLNRLLWLQDRDPIDHGDHVLQKTPFSFDVSVWEFFSPLLTGARLVLARPEGHKDSAYLIALTHAERLTTLHFVPSMLQIFVEEPGLEDLRTVVRVHASGEALTAELAVRFFARMPEGVALHNLYGPTEAAIEVTFWSCRPDEDVPIGRPVANTQLHILDRRGEPAPIGVPGQLFIAGVQVARGYLDRPRLTAEKFLPDPLASRLGARFYATGDLTRWRTDGGIAYLGRIDTQVKVRGFRIELGEIEAHLLDHPAVREAVVLAGDGRLFAFVVRQTKADDNVDVDADELRRHLGASLPEYMVPQVLTLLDELPLLPNGKIDRGALKKLAATSLPVSDAVHVAPRNPLEKLMAEIFADLLHLERASVESSFFALGGHSLLATRVVARIRSRLGVEVPLRQVFETPTAAGLARVLSRGERSELEPIVPLPDDARIEPSFSQERLWFLDQLEPGNSAYNIPLDFHVAGHLDVAALAAALGEIVRRHRVLRTVFELAAGEARPRLLPWRPFALPVVDLTALDAERRRPELHQLGREDSLRPFVLDRDLMLRARVVLLADGEQGLLLNLHHIAGDGWSLSVLVRELEILYSAACQDSVAVLPRLKVQYADFAAWQRRHLSGERRARQVAFWKEQLAGAPPLLELPTDRPRPAVPSQHGARHDHRLTLQQAAALRDMAQRLGATPFMVLLAALGITLGRSSGQSDLVIGAPIAGRLHVATESLIGFFLNNLVLRLRPGAEPGLTGFLAQVRETVLAAYAHQELPFEKLVEELQPERVLSYHPLFQVLLNLHNWDSPEGRTLPLGDLRLTWLDLEAPLAKLDLNVHVLDLGDDGFDFNWLYNRELFDATTIARLAHAFTCFLDACVAEPQRPWQQIAWQDRGERHQLLQEWNDTAAEPLDELLHTRFERRAASAPDVVALVYKATCLSYGELERRAADLARHLRGLGVGPEKLVGVHLERGLEMVTAVLGALEAGGAYVPLDPALPAERLRIMVDDSHAAAVLTQESLASGLQRLFADDALPIVVLDGFTDEPSLSSPPNPLSMTGEGEPEQPSSSPLSSHGEGGRGGEDRPVSVEGQLVDHPLPPRAADPENLAYVIYTSGTTGRPKGVMCRHQGAVSYLRFMLDTFHLEPGARTLQLASLAFDPSVRELFGPLGSGGTIVLIEAAERRDPTILLDLIDRERITGMLSVVPSLLRTLPDPGRDHGSWRSTLRTVMTNGEQLFLADVRQARQLLGRDLAVINQYGPTECTMVASTYPVPQTQTASSREVALIGRPITDRRVYVLGPDARPTPIGTFGELHIATADLARGYLDRPGQTAQVFIPDPWSAVPGGRRYATGDLVRRLRDGQLEFVGRRDHQVKVLGNRVELPEIEAVLRRHPQVAATVVMAWQKGSDIRLVAYLETSAELSRDALREHVKASLPEYMAPSLWIFLDRLPLNPNGKVDRRALPPPSTAEVGSDEEFIAPRSGVETLLAQIWSELLEVERVGVKDSFFHLGGHSLHGIRSLYRLRELLDVDLETRQLFEAQTLVELAPLVEARLLAQLEALTDDEAARQIASSPVEAATQRAELLDARHEAAPLPGELARRLLALSPAKLELRALRLHRALELGADGQAIPRRRDPQQAPLSWIQETFWLIEQQEQSTISVYRSSHRVTLNGRRDLAAMEAAVAAMVERHEILRTRFDVDDEGCTYQEILPALAVRLPRVDLSALHPEDHDAATESAVAQRSLIALDLGRPPLLHLLLIELSDERAHLLVILHHIITDHWSMGLFLREWRSLYAAATAHRPAELPELDVQYADYAEWERHLLEGEAMEPLMAYWGEKLAGGMPQLVLHTDRPRPAEPSFRGVQIIFELGPELTQALEARDRALGVSLFMTLLAAYKIVLFLHSDQTDILVASPAANRTRIQTEKMLGCFVHMMVLRTDLSGDPTLAELVDRVRETVLGAFAHQGMPFMVLVANFPPPDFAFDRSPFQTSFTFLNAPAAAAAKALEEGSSEASSLRLSDWESVDRGATDQDLALWMSREGGRLVGNLIYDVDLFDRSTVERIVEDYERVVERLANAPEERLSRLREIVHGRLPAPS